jgi:hypothetical protein
MTNVERTLIYSFSWPHLTERNNNAWSTSGDFCFAVRVAFRVQKQLRLGLGFGSRLLVYISTGVLYHVGFEKRKEERKRM